MVDDKMVDDKRLCLDIAALRESLIIGDLHALTWCPGEQQLADCMTKRGANGLKLLTVLRSGTLH